MERQGAVRALINYSQLDFSHYNFKWEQMLLNNVFVVYLRLYHIKGKEEKRWQKEKHRRDKEMKNRLKRKTVKRGEKKAGLE